MNLIIHNNIIRVLYCETSGHSVLAVSPITDCVMLHLGKHWGGPCPCLCIRFFLRLYVVHRKQVGILRDRFVGPMPNL